VGLAASDIDNDPRLLLTHDPESMLGHVGVARKIDCQHALIILVNEVLDTNIGIRGLNSGIVNQDIQCSEFVDRQFDSSFAIGLARDISADELHVRIIQVRTRRDIGTEYLRAGFRESPAGCKPDPVATSGH
jgi:hypothetical protein